MMFNNNFSLPLNSPSDCPPHIRCSNTRIQCISQSKASDMKATPAYISLGANRSSSCSVCTSSGILAYGAGPYVALWDIKVRADLGRRLTNRIRIRKEFMRPFRDTLAK
jgi:hypothetical protein